MLITDPHFYLIAIPVVLLTGISKTGIPGLFGGMAVPLLALVIPPLQAAAIMLPILCCIDLFGLRAFRGIYDRRNMPILLTGLAVGIVLGSLMFRLVHQDMLRLLIGAIAIAFALNNLFGPTGDAKKSSGHFNLHQQKGHNQTFGGMNKTGVPRRTNG